MSENRDIESEATAEMILKIIAKRIFPAVAHIDESVGTEVLTLCQVEA